MSSVFLGWEDLEDFLSLESRRFFRQFGGFRCVRFFLWNKMGLVIFFQKAYNEYRHYHDYKRTPRLVISWKETVPRIEGFTSGLL